MRFHFPNMTRPKKAAKRLADALPHLQLSKAQAAIACVLGYRDWHELESHHADAPPSVLDQELTTADFHLRVGELIHSISRALSVGDGDAQYVSSFLHLTGDRPYTFEDHEEIRTVCWRKGPMPWNGNLQPGAVFQVKVKGDAPYRAYVRKAGRPVDYISDTAIRGGCADFEAVAPKTRMKDFIPLRLWLPYGRWILEDGSEVLFSRDYKPLWRIQNGRRPERMDPWLWITGIDQEEWFTTADPSWHAEPTQVMVRTYMAEKQITALPKLVDALPLLVSDENLSLDDALDTMKSDKTRAVEVKAAVLN